MRVGKDLTVVFVLWCSGWKPRRTVMFCSWAAEEFGLIGSTEWVEVTVAAYNVVFTRLLAGRIVLELWGGWD